MTERRSIYCFVLDVAPGGAKIMTDAEIDVRDRFTLALVPTIRRASHAKSFGVAATYSA